MKEYNVDLSENSGRIVNKQNFDENVVLKALDDTIQNIPSAEWLSLPNVKDVSKFIGIADIYPDSNSLNFIVQGNYTVDWGDGTTNNYISGIAAEKEYNYDIITPSDGNSLCRQVVVQVTPQEGNSITAIDFYLKYLRPNLSSYVTLSLIFQYLIHFL